MLLRTFTPEDADRIALLVNDPMVSRWTAKIPYPYTRQHALDWIANRQGWSDRNPQAVVVDGEIVACVSWWFTEKKEVEVGYWVGRPYWGKGIGSRALALLLAMADFPKEETVVAKVLAGNTASERVLLKNGFQFTGDCTLRRMDQPVAGKTYVLPRGRTVNLKPA